jgi:hypothetical protein
MFLTQKINPVFESAADAFLCRPDESRNAARLVRFVEGGMEKREIESLLFYPMRSWKTVPRHQKLADDSAEIFENKLMEKKKGLRGQAFLLPIQHRDQPAMSVVSIA